jgi:hypothetical protein
MIELPILKVWTGDGFSANPVHLKQVKRTETVALYERWQNKGETFNGYEVFVIKKRLKGQPLPGGLFEEEDREVYPSAGQFGKTAWHMPKTAAFAKYDELVTKGITDEAEENEPEAAVIVPVIEFTCGDLAESNSITYAEAQKFLKENIDKTIKLHRTGRKDGQTRGKPSNFYVKI